MSYNRYAISAYQQVSRITTPSLQVVVMLYDGILAKISQAAEHSRSGNFQQQFECVMGAARIIDGLNRHLDMEKGGEVAVRLRDTYESLARTLFRTVGKPTAAEACDRIFVSVRDLRNAWAKISEEGYNSESVQPETLLISAE
jgi:flagellar protein FliS